MLEHAIPYALCQHSKFYLAATQKEVHYNWAACYTFRQQQIDVVCAKEQLIQIKFGCPCMSIMHSAICCECGSVHVLDVWGQVTRTYYWQPCSHASLSLSTVFVNNQKPAGEAMRLSIGIPKRHACMHSILFSGGSSHAMLKAHLSLIQWSHSH